MDYDTEEFRQAQLDMEFNRQLELTRSDIAMAQFEQAKALRRQEFAKAALPGLFNAPEMLSDDGGVDATKIARLAFEIADAMVAVADGKDL